MLSNSLIAIIARINPAIWEIVDGGPGAPWQQRANLAALNPQPLPPIAAARRTAEQRAMHYGAGVAVELVRAASTAQLLGVAFEPGDDICPPPRKFPHIPVPFPFPDPDPHPWYVGDESIVAYAAGLAFTLEATAQAWEQLRGADALAAVHDRALETAVGGQTRAE
ncbi:hypothetical protein LK09_15735 [Microbacterium mangrovi]|uniref:Uncharacterized protein n=1 Tax=Microbacterium mangrovi TaxID=1348253 RepID=A0A0B1ZYW5_9MICO|nr:hypothetical protein [Microbacterium mangrovi]KHK96410.1 hypothetical protein LK09_15735 [Microbacterium mangrovi]